MRCLHMAIERVALSAAKLTEVTERADDAPPGGGQLRRRVDAAMGQLDAAYQAVAAAFDTAGDADVSADG